MHYNLLYPSLALLAGIGSMKSEAVVVESGPEGIQAVLCGMVPPEILNGKVVFLGASAEGLMDNHPSPFDRSFPGVKLHATVAGAILDQDFITVPAWANGAKGVGIFLAILLALATICFVTFIRAVNSSGVPDRTSIPKRPGKQSFPIS